EVIIGDRAAPDDAAAPDLEAPGDVPGHHVTDVLGGEARYGQRVAGAPDGVEGGGVVALRAVLAGEPDVVIEAPGVAHSVEVDGVVEPHLGVVPGQQAQELVAVG